MNNIGSIQLEENQRNPSALQKLVATLQYFLSNRFYPVQKHVLSILGTLFERVEERCSYEIIGLIEELVKSKK
jgi:hypothetical protein